MEIINTHHAKTHLSQLLERAAQGEEFIIAKAGKPVARLIGYRAEDCDRVGGYWKDLVRVNDNFDEPLPEAISQAFTDPE